MKKKIIATILVLGAGLLLFAAGTKDTVVTIEGKLAVTKAVPTVVSGDKTWILPSGPFYQIAWENGIKVGDTIKAEGYAMDGRNGPADAPSGGKANAPANDVSTVQGTMFMPTKVWVNGKLIDISTVRMVGPDMNRPGNGPGNGPCMDGSQDDQSRGGPGGTATKR